MKKLLTLTFFLALSIQFSFSQHYAPFYTSSENVYLGDSVGVQLLIEEVLIAKVDSFTINGNDSILYPFKQLGKQDCDSFSLFYAYSASWMGAKIIKGIDSTVIYNDYDEEIYLKHSAQSGDKWTMFVDSNGGNYIEAKVLVIDTMYIQGKGLDSIKIITLQRKDTNGLSLASDLNGDSLILSKQYGIVQTYQWDYFPYTFWLNNKATQQNVRQLVDYEFLSYKDVYDLDTGDVFHYEDEYPFGWEFMNVKIINKWFSAALDRVYYKRDISKEVYTYFDRTRTDTTIYSFYQDTVSYEYTNDRLHDTLIPTRLSKSVTLSINLDHFNGRKMERVGIGAWNDMGDCFSSRYQGALFRENSYAKGIGRVKHQWTEFQTRTKELIYFKKGTESWGAPRLVIGINERTTPKNEFLIFPNPSKGILKLQLNANIFEVAIKDIQGKTVFQTKNENELNLSHLSKGVYFIEVRTTAGSAIQKLILKE